MSVSYFPSPTSGTVALAVAVAVLFLFASLAGLGNLVLTVAVGVSFLIAAVVFGLRQDRWVLGGAGVISGLFVVILAIERLAVVPNRFIIMLAPGFVGIMVLVLALFPVEGTGSRSLVILGTAGVFLSVLMAGVLHAPAPQLVLGAIGCVLAWDAGEQAISVGEHLGSEAESRPGEVPHLAASLLVGVGAFIVAMGVGRLNLWDLTLTQFSLLIVAGMLFMLALHE